MRFKKTLFAACGLLLTGFSFAQKENFDIASFIPPQGWQRIDTNRILAFVHAAPGNDPTGFCQIYLFPSRVSSGNARKDFDTEWNSRVPEQLKANKTPGIESTKTPQGWTTTTGYINKIESGLNYTCKLVTNSGFGKTMSVMVIMTGSDYAGTVKKFLENMNLDKNATASISNDLQNNGSNGNDANIGGAVSLSDYEFIVPDKWFVQKRTEFIALSQTQTAESGCYLQLLPPQPSSGNLEQDAKYIFSQMYPGWQFRYAGERHSDLSKGHTVQGLEYCMMEAGMSMTSADGRYHLEDGAALVVKVGNKIVIIACRHNRLEACECNRRYELWRRFFNSFTVKSVTGAKTGEDVSKRIIGAWTNSGGTVAMDYIFAANGNYQFLGGVGTTSKTSDYNYEYIHTRASAFQGDGSYSILGNELTIRGRGAKNPEVIRFRFEKVNHGGKGWKDRVYLLKRNVEDGKEYEVCYEKRD